MKELLQQRMIVYNNTVYALYELIRIMEHKNIDFTNSAVWIGAHRLTQPSPHFFGPQ